MSKDNQLNEQIIRIVRNYKIQEQIDLQQHLQKKGFTIAQATLSRRLRKLNIAKVSGKYQIIDDAQPHLPLIVGMRVSDNGLIVLHTHPGHANSLAHFLDTHYVAHTEHTSKQNLILGTIAGDDTVLLIVKNKAAIKNVISLIQQDFPYVTAPK